MMGDKLFADREPASAILSLVCQMTINDGRRPSMTVIVIDLPPGAESEDPLFAW
jgi:hypothetical protein